MCIKLIRNEYKNMKKILLSYVISFVVTTITAQTNEDDHEPGIRTALLPKPGECGTLKYRTKSTNGSTGLGEYPWTAQIAYLQTDTFPIKFKFTCNGALINVNHVVAPAFCVDNNPSFVRLGDWNTVSLIDCVNDICADPVLDVTIETTFYRSFNLLWTWTNNIGLIRLAEHVKYTDWISPICLPTAKYLYDNYYSYRGQTFDLVGFNENTFNMTNEIKYKVAVEVIKDEYCEDLYILSFVHIKGYDRFSKFCINLTETFCRGAGTVIANDYRDWTKPFAYLIGFYVVWPDDKCVGYQQIEKLTAHMQWITHVIKP